METKDIETLEENEREEAIRIFAEGLVSAFKVFIDEFQEWLNGLEYWQLNCWEEAGSDEN